MSILKEFAQIIKMYVRGMCLQTIFKILGTLFIESLGFSLDNTITAGAKAL